MSSQSDLPNEWASAHFDGESSELEAGNQLTESAEAFDAWQQLGDAIRAIPVQECDLSAEIRAEIQTVPAAAAAAAERRGSTALQWVAVVTSLAATIMVGINMYLESQLQNTLASLAPVQDWQVLVVHVPDTEMPSDLLDRHGMHLKSLSDSETALRPAGPEQLELVLASAEMSDRLQEAVASGSGMITELNPRNIGNLTREELLSKCAESLTSNTRSDEHFASIQVLVADNQLQHESVAAPGEDRIAEYVSSGRRQPVVVVLVRDKSIKTPQFNWLPPIRRDNRT